jgi:serine/threonine protein kinase, bacterial
MGNDNLMPVRSRMPRLMQLLVDKYELTELIGRGPNGTVWQASQRGTGETLAVKLLDEHLVRDPDVVDRFARERSVLTTFVHPAYVRFRELIDGGDHLALVMDLVTGSNLREYLAHSGGLALAQVAQIATVVAEALAAAHTAGIVHCDIRPSNLLLAAPSGEVWITDRRVARLARGYRNGPARFADPGYAAPEVILGGPPIPATDVYGLGLVMYEMVTGLPLCRGGDPVNVLSQHLRARPVAPSQVTYRLRELIEECLAVDPALRPTAADVAARLRLIMPTLSHEPQARPRPTDTNGAGRGDPETSVDASIRATTDPRPWHAERPPRRTPRTGRLALHKKRIAAATILSVIGTSVALAALSAGGPKQTPHHEGSPPAAQGKTLAGTPSTPTVPSLPAAATAASDGGAMAFARYWFAALGYATATGNTEPLTAASSPDCEICTDVSKAIHTGHQDGATMRGGEYTVREVTTNDFFNLQQPEVGVVFDRTPRQTIGKDGHEVNRLADATFATARLLLERSGGQWRVRAVQAAAPIA